MKYRKNEQSSGSGEVKWYGKPAPEVPSVSGDPVICYIVGGTCYSEVGIEERDDM